MSTMPTWARRPRLRRVAGERVGSGWGVAMSSVHDRSAHAIHDTAPAARRLPAAERLFYGGNAVFIAAAIFAGFWRSYLLRGLVDAPLHFPVPPSPPLVHVTASLS